MSQMIGADFVDLDERGNSTVLISGVARSGTTWLSQIINFDHSYREIFEPFHNSQVPEVSAFEYLQYFPRNYFNPLHINAAMTILSGKIRNAWSDRFDNPNLSSRPNFFNRRIVKDVRANFLLEWLHELRPEMPIVLVIRHPLAVAHSWRKLGWLNRSTDTGEDISSILRQPQLHSDFPLIRKMAASVSLKDPFEGFLFLWCSMVLVSTQQAQRMTDKVCTLFYEDLIFTFSEQITAMFAFLRQPFELKAVIHSSTRSAASSRWNRNSTTSEIWTKEFNSWQNHYSDDEISRCSEILQGFKLDHLYSPLDPMPLSQF